MPHLKETEFIELIDGALPPSRSAHVGACPDCTAQLDALRATLASLKADAGDEPSPLLWTTLPRRVAAAIDEPQQAAWWLRRPMLTALGCAAALVVLISAVALWSISRSSGSEVPISPIAENAIVPGGDGSAEDDVEADAAWAVVRTAADDLDYDDALAAGISAAPATADRAAMELPVKERAELVRLIALEMKRAGP